jgi:hypothetical protein
MRNQMCDLANRASQAGLVHIAYALEMAVVLLDDANRGSVQIHGRHEA